MILGCSGLHLTAEERAFYAESNPWGFILFARNIDTADQIRALCASLRDSVGRDAPILIDQEGGRVARLRAPLATEWQPPLDFVAQYPVETKAEAMRLRYLAIALELRSYGIDVNCAPMADTAFATTHPFLRNRCYGDAPDQVGRMARAVADGLQAGGVLPVLKHMPGHGRTTLDSHKDLPVVNVDHATLRAEDFAPFRALRDLPLGMTGHLSIPALDPVNCATQSPEIIRVIRREIGFEGLLMTDDLSMGALKGTVAERCEASLAAGCDLLLHCNGDLPEMVQAASVAGETTDEMGARIAAVDALRGPAPDTDLRMVLDQLAALTKEAVDA